MRLDRRSTAAEWMDAPDVDPADLADCLQDLATVNTATLARAPTIGFLRRATRGRNRLSVLDVGSGQGDMLRRMARWASRRGVRLDLAGIDLAPASADAARAATPASMAIDYRTGNVFDEPPGSVDVVVSSLFTHHLSDADVVRFVRWMERTARVGWFINDLHRHKLAFHGFRALSAAARWHEMVRHDGPISVARSFRGEDWRRLLGEAGVGASAQIRWHLPFRFCVTRLR